MALYAFSQAVYIFRTHSSFVKNIAFDSKTASYFIARLPAASITTISRCTRIGFAFLPFLRRLHHSHRSVFDFVDHLCAALARVISSIVCVPRLLVATWSHPVLKIVLEEHRESSLGVVPMLRVRGSMSVRALFETQCFVRI